jgi:hypothetical protein
MIEFYAPETMIDERIHEAERKAGQSGVRLQGELQMLIISQFSKNK